MTLISRIKSSNRGQTVICSAIETNVAVDVSPLIRTPLGPFDSLADAVDSSDRPYLPEDFRYIRNKAENYRLPACENELSFY
jgi:hypothetical protein